MRILAISNYYPPHFIGGYELGCHAVLSELTRRGHHIAVLTSQHGVGRSTSDGTTFRWLKTVDRLWDRGSLFLAEIVNQRALDVAFQRVRPDLVYVWNLGRLPITLALRAEQAYPVCYYVSDDWMSNWRSDKWRAADLNWPSGIRAKLAREAFRLITTVRNVTSPIGVPRFDRVQFCSAFMRQATLAAGVAVREAEVVYWGVDPTKFRPALAVASADRRRQLLFAGQIVPHKGVHIAVKAVGALIRRGIANVALTVAGASSATDYVQSLRNLAEAEGVDHAVRFIGGVRREDLPEVYRKHGTLLLPSQWDEPFAITPLEAMASGLAVVGTTRGGSAELLVDGHTALTFPDGDSEACADQLERLIREPDLWMRISTAGRAAVTARFTLQTMVDQLEASLTAELAKARTGRLVL